GVVVGGREPFHDGGHLRGFGGDEVRGEPAHLRFADERDGAILLDLPGALLPAVGRTDGGGGSDDDHAVDQFGVVTGKVETERAGHGQSGEVGGQFAALFADAAGDVGH